MSERSRIEWTDATWNPVTGCTPVSAGCEHCYARRMANRFHGPSGFDVTLHLDRLDLPRHWRKPRRVFVNSMGDLFHKDVPNSFILDVFRVMNEFPRHTFQVLTKRPERMVSMAGAVDWTPNIWAGVTVENQGVAAGRISYLQQVPASVRFISCEPLIGPITNLPLGGIGWVIVGGETGPGARQMDYLWPGVIRCLCELDRVPFFFKRWGGRGPNKNVRELDGRTWEQMPLDHSREVDDA
jgi:protein gp37